MKTSKTMIQLGETKLLVGRKLLGNLVTLNKNKKFLKVSEPTFDTIMSKMIIFYSSKAN